jgi:hypothetical protein
MTINFKNAHICSCFPATQFKADPLGDPDLRYFPAFYTTRLAHSCVSKWPILRPRLLPTSNNFEK